MGQDVLVRLQQLLATTIVVLVLLMVPKSEVMQY
jgi:hypothetical protein